MSRRPAPSRPETPRCACGPGRPCLACWSSELTDRQRRLLSAKLRISYGVWSRPQIWSQQP